MKTSRFEVLSPAEVQANDAASGSFGFGVVRLETTAGAVVGRVRGVGTLAQQ